MTIHDPQFWEAIRKIRSSDDRYEADAYPFVMESVEFTVGLIGERRHVSAHELIDGLCRYAKERFGLLALTVLWRWGIRTSDDIGAVVYQLVEAGVLSRRESDRIEDFRNGVNLREALEEKYFD